MWNLWFSKREDRRSLPNAIKAARRISLKTATGYTLALVCLFWVLRHLDLAELLWRVVHMNLAWVGASIFAITLSYLCQGKRWQLLLSPLSPVTLMRSTQAINAGLFVNEVLHCDLAKLYARF